jgi:hypothetical protein
MEDGDRGRRSLGRIALIAASHDWLLVLGLLAIIAMTYIAAYFLVSKIESNNGHKILVRTPFLTIRSNHLGERSSSPDSKPSNYTKKGSATNRLS